MDQANAKTDLAWLAPREKGEEGASSSAPAAGSGKKKRKTKRKKKKAKILQSEWIDPTRSGSAPSIIIRSNVGEVEAQPEPDSPLTDSESDDGLSEGVYFDWEDNWQPGASIADIFADNVTAIFAEPGAEQESTFLSELFEHRDKQHIDARAPLHAIDVESILKDEMK
jgi:hypothetical protein